MANSNQGMLMKRDAFNILSFRTGGCDKKNSPMLRLARCEAPGGFHNGVHKIISYYQAVPLIGVK